jgi:endonuclease YncB( thermonuclease family)
MQLKQHPMKLFPRFLPIFMVLATALSTLVGGCGFLQAPEPDVMPPMPEKPKPDFFNPADYNTKGIDLNKEGDPKLPDYFEVVGFDEPDVLQVRGVEVKKVTTGGTEREQLSYTTPIRVRLAGIYTARASSPNPEERRYSPMAMQAVRNWTLGRKLSIEQDSKFPVDLQNLPRVQIFFPGGKEGTQSINLNRFMVRTGYAVVDILEPTIFDTKGWLNDEQFAREHKKGLWPFIVMQSRQQPFLKFKTITTKTTTTTTTAPGSTPGSTGVPAAPTAPGMPAMPGAPVQPPVAP